MSSGESIPTLVLGGARACRIFPSGCVHVPGHLVLAGAAGVEVAYSPSVGGAEPADDPAIFYCCLKELDGLLVAVGAGAGA